MRFIFSAPFRTNINLSSLEAVDESQKLALAIDDAIKFTLSKSTNLFSYEIPLADTKKGELHFSELSEDCLPLSATPLFRLFIDEHELFSPSENIYNSFFGEHDFKVNKCSIDYYDNTIGILYIDLSFLNIRHEHNILSEIDKCSTKYCSSIIKLIKPIENQILSKLTNTSNKDSLFIKNGQFHVFFDRNNIDNQDPEKSEDMLWVTRFFFTPEDPDFLTMNSLHKWTQQSELIKREKSFGKSKISFCVGNSVIFGSLGKAEFSALKSSLSLSTYFYVLYSILNKNLGIIFLNISKSHKTSTSIITNVNRIRGHIEFIENEFSDAIMGLQGLRKEISQTLFETWNYADLVKSANRKNNSVEKVVNFSLQEKKSRYERIIESILAAIGGVTVLDFTLNLFSYSSDTKLSNDSVLGLTDASKYLSIDGTLYTIIIFLIFVLYLIIRKR